MTATRNALPVEKDGVLPKGNVVNGAANYDKSCWTRPDLSPILGISSKFTPGTCQVCIIQNNTDFSQSSFYELWVRDDGNQAIGGAGPFSLLPYNQPITPSNYIKVATAGKQLSMVYLPNSAHHNMSVVQLARDTQLPTNDSSKTAMQFYPYPNQDWLSPGKNCWSSGNTKDGAIAYFQCWFNCHK